MSFEVLCGRCGAPSGPSVGVCPFCKSPLASDSGSGKGKSKENATLTAIRGHYAEGRLERALPLATAAYEQKVELQENAAFLLLYAKILIETDGPKSRIRAILTKATLADPADAEVQEYLDIAEAMTLLRPGVPQDEGETLLRHVIRRSPKNPHASFILAAHLAWEEEGDPHEPIKYFVQCVRARPVYQRAWGALGALYKEIGNDALAAEAMRRAIKLESNPAMRKHMEKLIAAEPRRSRA